jgi:hypothetical protein
MRLSEVGSLIGDLPIWFMQFSGYNDIVFQLEQLGLFSFILPFLLMFAIVFGVLSYTRIFGEHRGVHVLIALVIGLLAVRFPTYTDFLTIIAPKLGIGLTILLVLIILVGLFIPAGARGIIGWVLVGIAFIIFLVIIAQTYSVFTYGYGQDYLTSNLIGYLILIALLIGVIATVAAAGGKKSGAAAIPESLKNILKPMWGD